MLDFKSFLIESESFLIEANQGSYGDEHAHVKVWNYMTEKGIARDKEAMKKELEIAKTDKTHPLHFKNAGKEGFTGGKKTKDSKNSYHAELETAMNTVHAMATHKDFAKAVKEKHKAKVMGGAKGNVSDTWKKYGATKGATSKTDIAIYDPKKGEHEGIRLSMKKGAGSQLMSGGPEENNATHHHAALEMLNNHPKYAKLSSEKKKEIHDHIMGNMKKAGKHVDAMRTASREDMIKLKNKAQKHIDIAHDAYPELNHYVRKEAMTGEGKFGKGAAHTASFLVKSMSGSKGAKVVHVDEHDHEGSRPRVALPKGIGRSGNFKLDER